MIKYFHTNEKANYRLKIKFNIERNLHMNVSSFLKVWFLGLDYDEEMELLCKMKTSKICFNWGYLFGVFSGSTMSHGKSQWEATTALPRQYDKKHGHIRNEGMDNFSRKRVKT